MRSFRLGWGGFIPAPMPYGRKITLPFSAIARVPDRHELPGWHHSVREWSGMDRTDEAITDRDGGFAQLPR